MVVQRARRGDGQPINPGDGVLPVLQELSPGRLKLVGTAFYVTRYGLVATARHVIEELQHADGSLGGGFVLHLAGDDAAHLRSIRKVYLSPNADVALLQADNYIERFPDSPLTNLRPRFSMTLPREGDQLATYAYPENEILEFGGATSPPTIRGDFFDGGFLRYVSSPENPALRFPYFESTVQLRSGSSGGPVFDAEGRIVAINCRGWDFGDDGDSLSYLVPIEELYPLLVDPFMIPPDSWEMTQIPAEDRLGLIPFRKLVAWGHVELC